MILSNEQKKTKEVKDWPKTEQVFELPNIDFQKHQWIQEGYFLIDSCGPCPRQGVPIPYGKVLVREEGKYNLIDEV